MASPLSFHHTQNILPRTFPQANLGMMAIRAQLEFLNQLGGLGTE
jgi:hypothetical protein